MPKAEQPKAWETEIVEKFLEIARREYLPQGWYCPTDAIEFLRSEIKKIIDSEVESREKELKRALPNGLHEYARWLLTEGKDAGPLQRKSKKEEISRGLINNKQ